MMVELDEDDGSEDGRKEFKAKGKTLLHDGAL